MDSKTKEKMPDCMIFLLAKAYQRAHGLFKQYLTLYGLTNLQHLVLEASGMKATPRRSRCPIALTSRIIW